MREAYPGSSNSPISGPGRHVDLVALRIRQCPPAGGVFVAHDVSAGRERSGDTPFGFLGGNVLVEAPGPDPLDHACDATALGIRTS